MVELKDLSIEALKNAIWDLNDGRCPGHGIYQSKNEIRRELIRRGEDGKGFHE